MDRCCVEGTRTCPTAISGAEFAICVELRRNRGKRRKNQEEEKVKRLRGCEKEKGRKGD
jgi:hypothetical protein